MLASWDSVPGSGLGRIDVYNERRDEAEWLQKGTDAVTIKEENDAEDEDEDTDSRRRSCGASGYVPGNLARARSGKFSVDVPRDTARVYLTEQVGARQTLLNVPPHLYR
jgi:hypothetical protein